MCTDSIVHIQQGAAALADLINSLSQRFSVSQDSCSDAATQCARDLTATGREAKFHCDVLCSHATKSLDGATEEVRVRAAQLEASAQDLVLEREVVGGEFEETSVAAVARALSRLSCNNCDVASVVGVGWDGEAALRAVDAALRVRGGVDRSQCIVRGEGIARYHTGHNSVTAVAVDSEGEVVENIQAGDVCVSVEGASLASMSVGEAGVVELVYHVPEGRLEPVCVRMSLCGAVMPGSPWTIPYLLGDSTILASVAPERVVAFLRELSAWLPRRAYTLLYRGSRDGMTAAVFHRLCDGKGPTGTLVLVRCYKRWVFGGHAGASWESGNKLINSGDAFLFSVTGPYTSAPVRFPIKADRAGSALHSKPSWGHASVVACMLRRPVRHRLPSMMKGPAVASAIIMRTALDGEVPASLAHSTSCRWKWRCLRSLTRNSTQ